MKIESFERNEEDKIVAINGDNKVVLSWEYVVKNKPQLGDFLVSEEGVVVPVKENPDFEELFAEPVEEVEEVKPFKLSWLDKPIELIEPVETE